MSKLYSISELHKLDIFKGLSRRTLYNQIKEGNIKSTRIGKKYFVSEEVIQNIINN